MVVPLAFHYLHYPIQTDNPKEYWSLVNQLRNEHSDKPESSIDGETWYKYFSELTYD
jgi:hypothetical protein